MDEAIQKVIMCYQKMKQKGEGNKGWIAKKGQTNAFSPKNVKYGNPINMFRKP